MGLRVVCFGVPPFSGALIDQELTKDRITTKIVTSAPHPNITILK